MVRIDRLDQTLDEIHKNPHSYDQKQFVNECGTAFCIAGWAMVFKCGSKPQAKFEINFSGSGVMQLADEWYGLDDRYKGSWTHPLYDASLRLSHIVKMRNELAAEQGLPKYVPPERRQDDQNRQT